jgi:HemY protein
VIRVLAFLVVIALAAVGIGWLIDQPGSLVLVWHGWQIETTVPVALLGVALLTIALLLLWWFFQTIFHIPDAISGFLRGRRRKRGLGAVAHGLVAIGVGDGRAARRAATEARRLIGDEPLTLLLRAQAAQLSGDRMEAEAAFRAMLEKDETRALGYRGLFVEARRRGDTAEALQTVQQAARSDRKVPWAGPALLEMQSAAKDWDGALAAIESNVSAKLLDRAAGRRQRAVVLTAQALELAESNPIEARTRAVEAVDLAPDLVPAAALAGRLLAEAGDYRKAAKITEKAWKLQPHPDLAEVYLNIRPGDAAQDRLARARLLFERTDDPEGALALARASLDGRDFALARRTLAPLVERGATRRTCLLMAELDDAEFSDSGRSRAWLSRALVARPDPAWIADGVVAQNWQPTSPVSGKLDAFTWAVPQESLTAAGSHLIDADVEAIERAASGGALQSTAPSAFPVEEITAPEAETKLSSETPAAVEDVAAAEVLTPAAATPEAVSPALAQPRGRLGEKVTRASPPPEIVLPLARAPDDPGPDEGDVLPVREPVRVTPSEV